MIRTPLTELLGIRYPIPSVDVVAMLGYRPNEAVAMPARLVGRLPVGPTLDPLAAVLPAA